MRKYAKDGERKWSYFDEFYKSKDLREMLKVDSELADDFCRWVGDGRIPEGADVRRLGAILKNAPAAKKFWEGPVKTAFAEAQKIVHATDPEQNSDFFKLLAKMRESCTDSGQVREILRIRSDKIARQRVLDTYNALVDFMQLADVELPESK